MTNNPDIIFVSLENWDEIWRRNQFVCAELARRCPTRRILFVGLPRRPGEKVGSLPSDQPNITFVRPYKVVPTSLPGGRRINQIAFRYMVRQAARSLQFAKPLLWLNPHDAVHMVGKMDEQSVIYDITDDWEKMSQPARLVDQTREQDRQLGKRADAVIVCSEDLRQAKERKFGRKIHLIPNGVDAAHYVRVMDDTLQPPEEARPWKKPVLGYTGTLHADRLDLELIEHLATTNPSGTVALIGPDFLSIPAKERLLKLGNVFLTGPVPYREIPDWMRAFDVCVVPHRVTPFTESLNPIKLWEYLAAGKPIVATKVAGFRDYPELVYLANDREEFTHAISEALREPADLKSKLRQAEARKNSWSDRVDQIEQVMAQCLSPSASRTGIEFAD